jgi:hypothetical protein
LEFDLIALAGVVGILLPLVISFLKNIGSQWNQQLVRVFAFVVCIAAAFVTVGAQEGWTSFDINQIIGSFTVIYTLAQTSFKGLWQNTKVEAALASTFDKLA